MGDSAMRAAVVIGAAFFLASTALAFGCGKERWPVKVGTDQDDVLVIPPVRPATISALGAIAPPPNPNVRMNNRFAPVETSVASIQGILVVIKREDDQDYHLVIVDPQNPLATMIVESPDPSCAAGSLFIQEIVQVRQAIEARFGGPITGRHVVSLPVTVTGVPFFDRLHGQEGVAPNGIELHPILNIQFN
jgi:hypothetical protein